MMYRNLENYLEEVNHFLIVSNGREDILQEIRSHILEKTDYEYGTIDEKGIGEIIKSYGSPEEVASKYSDGYQIISPNLRNYLFMYTGILFAFHFGLAMVALITRSSITILPFFYIPDLSISEMFSYIPFALIFDFGLACGLMMLITHVKKDIRLPWLYKLRPFDLKERGKPVGALIGKIIWFAVIIALFKYNYLIPQEYVKIRLLPENLTNAIMALLIIGIAFGFVKLLFNNELVDILASLASLVCFWFIIPLADSKAISGIVDENIVGYTRTGLKSFFIFVIIIIVADMIKNIIRFSARLSSGK